MAASVVALVSAMTVASLIFPLRQGTVEALTGQPALLQKAAAQRRQALPGHVRLRGRAAAVAERLWSGARQHAREEVGRVGVLGPRARLAPEEAVVGAPLEHFVCM